MKEVAMQGEKGDVPLSAVAARLAESREADRDILYVARGGRRAASLARILAGLVPGGNVLAFPAWDCVPYDRTAPSQEVMGQRVATLRRLALEPPGGRVVVATAAALAQRVPPRAQWEGSAFRLEIGDPLDFGTLEAFLLGAGYVLDERVDVVGEAAIRGAVVDLFPAGAEHPVRLDHAEGRITGIRRYDPASQRTLREERELTLIAASEVVLPTEQAAERFAGVEHFLPDFCAAETLFDALPQARIVVEAGADETFERFCEQVEDAHETRRATPLAGARPPLDPARLYLDRDEWESRLAALQPLILDLGAVEPVPAFAREAEPMQALAAFTQAQTDAGRTLVLAATERRDARGLLRALRAATDEQPVRAADWADVLAAPRGSVLTLVAHADRGFVEVARGIALVTAADLLGSRAGQGGEQSAARAALGLGEMALRPGDAVVHLDHGTAVLRGIETVTPPDGTPEDAAALEFAGGAKLLMPVEALGRIWRYGASEGVSLDRLDGTAWPKRRAELEADLARLAEHLMQLAAERMSARAERLVPPKAAYERFAAGFAFTETPDQLQAIEEVLADLAAGRPMDRLVCGDVGFGKTEVALRAAAAAALAGRQVAVVAPTTVLVRQHVRTFRRRFAGFGLEVAHLSRLVSAAEARAVKKGLASGETRIVVGTHALAGRGVTFKDLGLLIVDEEQRFGAAQKEKLKALGRNVHVLTLTATPIPRTLQAAMVGLKDLSVIATPPARRQPVRTFLTSFDPVSVRTALLRERQRGGQSFVVCPRIEDIEPMRARLGEIAPELQVVAVHGKMPAETIDAAMVDFADGVGDVLLATNIIESGLDVPRANTILIWRPDRFGLAQLHQLRGRVGRGRSRGTAYLMTESDADLGTATERRLRALESFDRFGAGFAISGRDLDLRGSGDLVGEEQAGHVKLIGPGLYRHLLERALATARGEAPEEDWTPAIRLGLAAAIPESYIPEPEIRIGLHARLARMGPDEDPDEFAEELADRFGPLPEEVANLMALASLRREARALGIERLDAGPQAIAASFRAGMDLPSLAARVTAAGEEMVWRGERLVWQHPTETPEERRAAAARFLRLLARPAPRRSLRRARPEPVAAE
jgi:transcription-repair coupling factor (superfamily II helicase)